MNEPDIFIKNSIYPDASSIFNTVSPSLEEVKKNCLFVVDTNTLLLPYYSNSQDLDQIRSIFSSLIDRKRLFVPGQVAREFANNRSDRIKEIFQQLNRRLTTIQDFKASSYPLLNGLNEYRKLLEIEKDFNKITQAFKLEYKLQLDQVLNQIKEWSWNDPVSDLYRDLFTKEVVHDLPIDDRLGLKKELDRRYAYKIPPGYKDQSKTDEGVGDLIIWFTILDLAKKFKKSVVFVTGEEKSDWLLKSDGQILYPRFELIFEFNTVAPNNSFHIIKLSQLVQLLEGSTKLVNEIRDIEKTFYPRDFESIFSDNIIQDSDNPVLYKIYIELDLIKNTIVQFITKRDPELVGNEVFLDDLNKLHRNGILSFDIYKRLMNFYAVYYYNKKEALPLEIHFQNLHEIMALKILTFEALANAY